MARRQAELDAVVGQYRVDFVRDGFDERDEEGRSGDAIGFLDQLNEGELRRAVDGDEEVELSLGSLHFGDVDVEEGRPLRCSLWSMFADNEFRAVKAVLPNE